MRRQKKNKVHIFSHETGCYYKVRRNKEIKRRDDKRRKILDGQNKERKRVIKDFMKDTIKKQVENNKNVNNNI